MTLSHGFYLTSVLFNFHLVGKDFIGLMLSGSLRFRKICNGLPRTAFGGMMLGPFQGKMKANICNL